MSSWQGCQSQFFHKEEKQDHLSRYQIGENQGEREPLISEREGGGGSEREQGKERVSSTANEGKFQKGRRAQRNFLGERVSRRKSFPGESDQRVFVSFQVWKT